jgi:hypothetical protein
MSEVSEPELWTQTMKLRWRELRVEESPHNAVHRFGMRAVVLEQFYSSNQGRGRWDEVEVVEAKKVTP